MPLPLCVMTMPPGAPADPPEAPSGGPAGGGQGATSGAFSGEVVVDARGSRCPIPMLALGQAVDATPAASSWLLVSDDPATEHDVPAWCRMRGLADLGATSHDGLPAYRVGRRPEDVAASAG